MPLRIEPTFLEPQQHFLQLLHQLNYTSVMYLLYQLNYTSMMYLLYQLNYVSFLLLSALTPLNEDQIADKLNGYNIVIQVDTVKLKRKCKMKNY